METYDTALVLGLGDSGEAAARLLRAEGTSVTVLDRADAETLRERTERLTGLGIEVLTGDPALPGTPFDICVVSPGVPLQSSWVRTMQARGVPVISELELGWSRCRSRVFAITGSNGKSTAVKWCRESLEKAGLKARAVGNYGLAVSEFARSGEDMDWLVMEVSSFQLETVRAFRPEVGVVLNVYPNHLDRHGDMRTYTSTKAALFRRTMAEDVCVAPEALVDAMRSASHGGGQWVTFGTSHAADYRWEEGRVFHDGNPVANLSETCFSNPVTGLNAAAVVAGLDACGIDLRYAEAAAQELEPLPHRMAEVATVNGVLFIDDSKATNLAALEAAVRTAPGPVRLIAGGVAKEKDYHSVKERLVECVTSVYLFGRDAQALGASWSDRIPCIQCGTLGEAVRGAWNDSSSGETIVLSPGCASFY